MGFGRFASRRRETTTRDVGVKMERKSRRLAVNENHRMTGRKVKAVKEV